MGLFIKKYSTRFLLGFAFIVGVIFFQNCSDINLIGNLRENSNHTTTQGQTGPADVVNFSDMSSSQIVSQSTSGGWGCDLEVGSASNLTVLSDPNIVIYPNGGSVVYQGKPWGLTIITNVGNECTQSTGPAVPNPLDVLARGKGSNLRFWTWQGIYAIRFKTPSNTFAGQFDFLLDAGGIYSQNTTISRYPGDLRSGVSASLDFCPYAGGGVGTYSFSDPSGKANNCKLKPDTVYYFNILIDGPSNADEPTPGNSSQFTFTTSCTGYTPADLTANKKCATP